MTTPAGVSVRPDRIRLGTETLPLHADGADAPGGTGAGSAAADATVVTVRGDTRYRLRAWTFGERRRLLAAHVRPDVGPDVDAMVAAAAARLVRPVPADPAERELLGLAALAWSATGGAAEPAPVPAVDPAVQAVRLAAATGWRPSDLDGALAADVDRWFAALTPAGSGEAGSGNAPAADGAVDDGFRSFRLEG